MNEYRRSDYATEVNGETVPTMKFMLSQIGWLGQRIDRATTIGSAALLMATAELIAIIWLTAAILR